MTQCIHTGAVIYLAQYDANMRCDLYRSGDTYIARAVGQLHDGKADGDNHDWFIDSVDQWFDRGQSVSTIICAGVKPCSEAAQERVKEEVKGEPMDPHFSVFNLHVNNAGDRARALMGQHFKKQLEEVEQIEKDGGGIMAIFENPPTPATSVFVALVTTFVNEDREPSDG